MSKIILKNVYLNYPIFSSDSRSFKKNVLNQVKSEKFKKNKSDILHIQALKNINMEIYHKYLIDTLKDALKLMSKKY